MNPIKFCEKQGIESFDWNEFLLQEHSAEQWEVAKTIAGDWVTCACGNLCSEIPRDAQGRPMDLSLRGLGVIFYNHISDEKPDDALEVLEGIEKRSAKLLEKMNEQLH